MAEISQLSELKEIPDEDFTVIFVKSLYNIFKWVQNDIVSTLTERNFDKLLELRNALCDQAKETFPTLSAKTAINRRVKHLVVKDIVILGECLANETQSSDLEKVVFCQTLSGVVDVNPCGVTLDNSSGEGGLQMVVGLVRQLQSTVQELVVENKLLREKVENLVEKVNRPLSPPSVNVDTSSADDTVSPIHVDLTTEVNAQHNAEPGRRHYPLLRHRG